MKPHFKPINKYITFWDDTQILVGEKWETKIEDSLKSATVGLLLISSDYLASDYVLSKELPFIINKAESNQLKLVIIILRPCLITEFPELMKFQMLNSPSNPLSSMSNYEQEEIFVRAMLLIKSLSKNN